MENGKDPTVLTKPGRGKPGGGEGGWPSSLSGRKEVRLIVRSYDGSSLTCQLLRTRQNLILDTVDTFLNRYLSQCEALSMFLYKKNIISDIYSRREDSPMV